MRRIMGLWVGLLAACQSDVAEKEQYACTSHTQCAPGFTCNAGICVPGPLPVDAEADAASDAAGEDVGRAEAGPPEDAGQVDRGEAGDAGVLDDDGDGHPNEADTCPDDANPDQLDTDGDGVGDVCDRCVAEAGPEDGCPSNCAFQVEGDRCYQVEKWDCPSGCGQLSTKFFREGFCRAGVCVAEGEVMQAEHDCGEQTICVPTVQGSLNGCLHDQAAEVVERCAGFDGVPCMAGALPGRTVAGRCCAWSAGTLECNEQGPRHPLPGRQVNAARFALEGDLLIDHETRLVWHLGGAPLAYPGADAAHQVCQSLGRGWHVPSVFELQTLAFRGPFRDVLVNLVGQRLEPVSAVFVTSTVWFRADGQGLGPLGVQLAAGGAQKTLAFPTEESLFLLCVRPLIPFYRNPEERRVGLSRRFLDGEEIVDPWTGVRWVEGTASGGTQWERASLCLGAGVRGNEPAPGLRPADLLEVLSIWQPNPAGIQVDLNGVGNERYDWLRLPNHGTGLRAPNGLAVDPAPLHFGADPVPGSGVAWLVNFIHGGVVAASPGDTAQVRCIREP